MNIASSLDQSENKKTTTFGVTFYVFVLTVTLYLLSFSGVPISDDEELYASAARNLAINGKINAEQLYGSLRLKGSYHGVEPGFPAIASVWYRLFLRTKFGHLQSLYLLPILLTGSSVALISLIATQLNYSNKVGAVAALLYGLSTMAWPYAKTFFREPLIAFLLLCCLFVFIILSKKSHHLLGTVLIAVVLLLLLGLLFLTKVVMIGVAFAFFIVFLYRGLKEHRGQYVILLVCGSGILAGLILFILSPKATDSDVFYRFSRTFLYDALTRLFSISHAHFWEALLAPLFSPWKGLFFYSPAGLLGLVSFVRYGRRRLELFFLPISVLAILLLSQALAYDSEWWTPTWGSRFLLPVIPLLVISSLPVIEELTKRPKGLVILGCLFTVGALIQLPAILFNSAEFTSSTYLNEATFPAGYVWNIIKTPIVNQWRSIATQQPDLLLWRSASTHPALDFLIVVLALGIITTLTIYLRRNLMSQIANEKHIGLSLASWVAGIALISILMLRIGSFDPAYYSNELQPMCSFISNNIKAGDIMIVRPYPGPAWQYFMNYECGQKTWYSLPYKTESTANSDAIALLRNIATQSVVSGSGIWFIDQFWSQSFEPQTEGLPLNNYNLSYKKYFYNTFNIFAGYYTSK